MMDVARWYIQRVPVYCAAVSHCHRAKECGVPISLGPVTHWNIVLRLAAASPHTTASWRWTSAADTPSFHQNHVFRLCPWWSHSIVHDRTPMTEAIVPLKRNLHHPLLPFVEWMINYHCRVTDAIFGRLAISVHTLKLTSVNHLWTAFVWTLNSRNYSLNFFWLFLNNFIFFEHIRFAF
jgi:hypothetical protein